MARNFVELLLTSYTGPVRQQVGLYIKTFVNLFNLSLFVTSLVLVSTSVGRAQESRLLYVGSAIVTGFSGIFEPLPSETLPKEKSAIDETFIDPTGISARIYLPDDPGFLQDGRNWELPPYYEVQAMDVGQVFGIAIDSGWPDNPDGTVEPPNVYLSATSAFGLNIVIPDVDNNGFAERVKIGQSGAYFMDAQFGSLQGEGSLFGQNGGPGSIYKIDGRSGDVSLFANITFEGVKNSGAALGNIAFDPVHNQLFVSDRDIGMIHRLDLDGNVIENFDHGVVGRVNEGLSVEPFDAGNRLDITDPQFDSEDPDTWAYAKAERRIWGLAVNNGRLYYAVAQGPQIWSVGIDSETGVFLRDARWELDVWPEGPGYEVSDVVFSDQGAMILAQRGQQLATYDYSSFMKARRARVYRYWLEDPDDPLTQSRWRAEPQEYLVGFQPNYRNTTGGVDLGYGYNDLNRLDAGNCQGTIWSTGDSLRINQQMSEELLKGGELVVRGLQGSPSDIWRQGDNPSALWQSYFIDFDNSYIDPQASGQLGDVEVYRPCYQDDIHDVHVEPDVNVDVALAKNAGGVSYDPQSNSWILSYIFDILNVGQPFAPNSNIQITDQPPEGSSISNISGDNWVCNLSDFPIFAPDILQCTYDFGEGEFGTGEHLDPLQVDLSTGLPGTYNNCGDLLLRSQSGLVDDTVGNNYSCDDNETKHDISIEKTAEPVEFDPEIGLWVIKYTLQVQNLGDPFYPQSSIEITDLPPNGLTITNLAGTNWTCNTGDLPITAPGQLQCNYNYGSGLMATGEYLAPLEIKLTAEEPGTYVNCASTGFDNNSPLIDVYLPNNESCAESGTGDTTLTVEKAFEGDIVSWLLPNAVFPMNVVCTDGTSVTVNLDFSNGGVASVSGIVAGSDCTVTEGTPQNTPLPADCTWAATYNPPQPVNMSSEDENVIVTNYLECGPGDNVDISIEKLVSKVIFDPMSGAAGQWTFTYTLTVTNNGTDLPAGYVLDISDVVPGGVTFTGASGNNWTCPSSQFPLASGSLFCSNTLNQTFANGASTDVLVISASAQNPGVYNNCALVGISNPPGIVETDLTNNTSCIPVELIRPHPVETTSLTLIKLLSGQLQSYLSPSTDFQVNVTCLPSGYTDTLTLNLSGGLSDTATGIPVGDTCTIAEILPPTGPPIAGGTVVAWFNNYPLGNTITVTQGGNNLEVYNGFYALLGPENSLTINKTFDFSATPILPDVSGLDFLVEAICTAPVLQGSNAFYLFNPNSANGFSTTQNNIAYGSSCTISEIAPTDIPGCVWAPPTYPLGQIVSQAALSTGNVVLEVKNTCLPFGEKTPDPGIPDSLPDLKITKVGPANCEAGKICTFSVEVTNVGPGGFNGPAFITDVTGTNGVKLVGGGNANGWSCNGRGGTLATCINPSLSLTPGQSTRFDLPFRLPSSLRRDSSFENCTTLVEGKAILSDNPVLFTQMVLGALGYDPGPADGLMGPKTNAAIETYKEALGLTEDDEINVVLGEQISAQGVLDTNPNNNTSCAAVQITKDRPSRPAAPDNANPHPAGPTSTPPTPPNNPAVPACVLPSVYDPISRRCVNILNILPGGGVGEISPTR